MRRARLSSDSVALYNVATVPGHCDDPSRLSFDFEQCARNYLPSIQACFARFVCLDEGEHCLISIALARPGTATAGQRAAGALTWVREGERALVDVCSYPINATSVRALAALDVGADSDDELVVFGDGVDGFGFSTSVLSLSAQHEQPLHDSVRSAALDGVRSLDEARASRSIARARPKSEPR